MQWWLPVAVAVGVVRIAAGMATRKFVLVDRESRRRSSEFLAEFRFRMAGRKKVGYLATDDEQQYFLLLEPDFGSGSSSGSLGGYVNESIELVSLASIVPPPNHEVSSGFSAVVDGKPVRVRAVLERTVVIEHPEGGEHSVVRKDNCMVKPSAVAFVPSSTTGPGVGARQWRRLPNAGKSDRSDYETELAKLQVGRISFNPPAQMTVGRKERIETRLGRKVIANLGKELKGHGEVKEEDVKVGPNMTVTLQGPNFDIFPLNSDEQLVSEDSFTQWAWDVTPERRGVQTLVLRVAVRLRVREVFGFEVGSETVLERNIPVRVNALHSISHFVSANWKWLVATVLSAVVAAVLTDILLNPPHF